MSMFTPVTGSDTSSWKALINALVTALNSIVGQRTYKWANAAARGAQTGMSEGDVGDQADTDIRYRYSGSAWEYSAGKLPVWKNQVSTNQSIASTATWTLVNAGWGTASPDRGMTSFASGVLTVETAGLYHIDLGAEFSNASAVRMGVQVTKNNATPNSGVILGSTISTRNNVSTSGLVQLEAGDALRFNVYQETGGASNLTNTVNSFAVVQYVGPA